MTDTQLFLCVVIFFYLTGRCIWRPAGTVAFRSLFFGHYKLLTSSSVMGNRSGSILICDLFIPFSPTYLVDLARVLHSPKCMVLQYTKGSIGFSSASPSIEYEKIFSVKRGNRSVSINDVVAIKCRSQSAATRLTAEIEMLRARSDKARSLEIERAIKRRFDLRGAKKRVRRVRKHTEFLRYGCNLWLAAITGLNFLVFVRFGQSVATLSLLIFLEIAAMHLGITFFVLHARLFPEDRRNRVGDLFKFLLCPPTVFQCVDAISFDLLADMDPLVVAYLVCRPSEFERVCTRTLRRLRFSRAVERPEELWFTTHYERCLRQFLKSIGCSIADYFVTPRPLDMSCQSYCPRCEAQYRSSDGFCAECDIPLVPLVPVTENKAQL